MPIIFFIKLVSRHIKKESRVEIYRLEIGTFKKKSLRNQIRFTVDKLGYGCGLVTTSTKMVTSVHLKAKILKYQKLFVDR